MSEGVPIPPYLRADPEKLRQRWPAVPEPAPDAEEQARRRSLVLDERERTLAENERRLAEERRICEHMIDTLTRERQELDDRKARQLARELNFEDDRAQFDRAVCELNRERLALERLKGQLCRCPLHDEPLTLPELRAAEELIGVEPESRRPFWEWPWADDVRRRVSGWVRWLAERAP